jgi:hypothetical protein
MVIDWLVCPISSENLYALEGRVCTTRSAVDRENEVFSQLPTAHGQAQNSAEEPPQAACSSCLKRLVQPARPFADSSPFELTLPSDRVGASALGKFVDGGSFSEGVIAAGVAKRELSSKYPTGSDATTWLA